MNDEDRQKVLKALKKKGVYQPCSRCSSSHFELVGPSFMPITPQWEDTPTRGGKVIRVVIIWCSNCGLVTSHALEVLDLEPITQEPSPSTKPTTWFAKLRKRLGL